MQIQILSGNQIGNQVIGKQQFVFQGEELDPAEIKQALIDFVAANLGEEHAQDLRAKLAPKVKTDLLDG